MRILVDSNVLLRAVQPTHPMHAVAIQSVDDLFQRGFNPVTAQQNIAEFWNVATRPLDKNGLGLACGRVQMEIAILEADFEIVYEDAKSFAVWKALVAEHQVIGAKVHDARLASIMIAQNIAHTLTFNVRDFARYPGITALHPTEVIDTGPLNSM